MDEKPSERIKQRLCLIFLNSLWLLPLIYGIKCLVTLNGKYPKPKRTPGSKSHWPTLAPVEGDAAVWAGLGFIALAVFICSLVFFEFDPDEPIWPWVLVFIRWGSLIAALCFWLKAGHM
jgi:hypothetical protein